MRKKLNISPKLITCFDDIKYDVSDKKLIKLVEDIRIRGIKNPLYVYDNEDGTYCLSAGYRRLCAAFILNLDTIPVKILDDYND